MTTRLKTVNYAFTTLASITNNTLTNLTQLSISLPETGTKVFKSVILTITADDIITATGGSITTKTLSLRLNAAAYTSVANANILTNSGENISICLTQDFTSHFTTNWTGTSCTCDVQLQLNQSTGTTLGFVNVSATLEITYQYDDTSATQIKTVMIPLNAPTGALTTSAVTYDTIPVLDTYLPESSKVYRNIHIVYQGNEHRNAVTTDNTLTLRVGAANITTGNYEGALASDRFIRYIWNLTGTYPSTASTQTFQLSSTVARGNHSQSYLVVTYEYREDLSTSIMNSVMLPMDVDSPFGGPTSGDYQKATRDLWIQEPGTITTSRVAFYCFWTQATAIAGLNLRIGSGSFITYTDAASTPCGNNACMVRNDSAFTLVRGKNTFNFDAYRTSTTNFGWNIAGFWIVNYISSKSTLGSGSHNHTVFQNIYQMGTAAITYRTFSSSIGLQIPETNYFINAVGTRLIFQNSTTVAQIGYIVQVERTVSEGGMTWETAYKDISQTDSEVGVYHVYSQMRDIFKRFPTDNYSNRIDVTTNRRWVTHTPAVANTVGVGWPYLTLICTYHSISYSVTGSLTNFNVTPTITVFRENSYECIGKPVPISNSFTMTWYDNTVPLVITANEPGVNGLSGAAYPNVAGNVFNITAQTYNGNLIKYFAY